MQRLMGVREFGEGMSAVVVFLIGPDDYIWEMKIAEMVSEVSLEKRLLSGQEYLPYCLPVHLGYSSVGQHLPVSRE